MSDELPLCPFCGSKPERWVLWDHVRCPSMECSLYRVVMHRVEWGTRAEDPVKAELIQALERTIEAFNGVSDENLLFDWQREAREAVAKAKGGRPC